MTAAIKEGGGATEFGRWVQENKWKWGEIFKILGVRDMSEISDYKEAMNKVKEAKGIK